MQRRHDLDWVRVLAFGLLVLYHVGMYYVSWDWHVKSPFASPALEPLMFLTSPWRLSLLFLISGVALAHLLNARPERLLRTRSWRLLVPLLFGMIVVVTPQAYYEVIEKAPGGFNDGYLAFWSRYLAGDPTFCREGECLDLPTWNHLWFVVYLWVYTMVVVGSVRAFPRISAKVGNLLARQLEGVGLLLWPAAALAVARLALVGTFESTHALVDDWYNHAQYLGVFALGFLLGQRAPLWDAMRARRHIALAIALVSYLAWTAYAISFAELEPPTALRMAMRLVWSLNQWTAIVAILGYARHFAPGDSPALRYLSQAVFPVYILHQTVIVVLAHEAQPLGLHPAVEGPLLVLATFTACFAGYEVIRRITWLRPLFGLKAREPRATHQASQLASGAA